MWFNSKFNFHFDDVDCNVINDLGQLESKQCQAQFKMPLNSKSNKLPWWIIKTLLKINIVQKFRNHC